MSYFQVYLDTFHDAQPAGGGKEKPGWEKMTMAEVWVLLFQFDLSYVLDLDPETRVKPQDHVLFSLLI